jgi:hypothetical protein
MPTTTEQQNDRRTGELREILRDLLDATRPATNDRYLGNARRVSQ